MNQKKISSQQKRSLRNKAKIRRFSDRVRLVIFRSSKHIYAQLVDQKGKSLATVSDLNIKNQKGATKTQTAELVGKQIAQKAQTLKVKQVVFDRNAYKYHGRVKAVCEAARAEKLII
jgi:large subunit ribosomal protein L18